VTRSAGGAVLNLNGEVLIVRQPNDTWSLPKGHIEAGEDALSAARREIAEESGVTELLLVKELGTYERFKIGLRAEDKSEKKRITMFLFRTEQTALEPRDPHNPEARWVAPKGVAGMLTHKKDREFFRSVVEELS